MYEKEYQMYQRLQKLMNAARNCIGLYNELASDWNNYQAKSDDERFPYYKLAHANSFYELMKD